MLELASAGRENEDSAYRCLFFGDPTIAPQEINPRHYQLRSGVPAHLVDGTGSDIAATRPGAQRPPRLPYLATYATSTLPMRRAWLFHKST